MSLTTKATSPAQLSNPENDYAGIGSASFARLNPASAGTTLTGVTGGTDGKILTIANVGNDDLTITHDDAASAAANRFYLKGGASLVLGGGTTQGSTAVFIYDNTSQRWREIARTPSV